MNYLNIRLTMAALLLTMAGAAIAQPSQTITLDQAIRMGMDYSHLLDASQGRYEQSIARRDQTFDLGYPTSLANGTYYRLSDVPEFTLPGSEEPLFPVYQNDYQGRVSLNQLVFAGFRVKTAKDAADKTVQSSQFDLKRDEADVKLNIITAYYNLYKVQQSVEVIYANKKLIDQRVADVRNLEKNGLATYNDVLRLELQQSNIELTQIDAENILRSANYNFNLLIGLPGDVQVILDTTGIFAARAVSTNENYQSSALQLRPEIQSALLRNQVAEDNLKIAQRAYYPTVMAGANLYLGSPNMRYVPPTDVLHTTWDVGVGLTWNITNLYTNRHVIAENEAIIKQAKALQLQTTDNVKSEVYQSYLAYSEALDKTRVSAKAVDQAHENMRVTESRYNNSLALVSDLTDAQAAQIQAEISLIIARADAQIAYYKLQKSSGNF